MRIISNISILLIIYIPTYYFIGENIVITLIILLITIILGELITSKISLKKTYKYLNIISLFLIIFTYLLFWYLTYYPPKYQLFKDSITNKYGLDK